MKYRDLVHNPERAIVVMDSSKGPSYTPNMQNGSIFRITDTVNVTLVNPKHLKDGMYIRLEISTLPTNTITFGDEYSVNGVALDPVTNSTSLYILEGRNSTVLGKILLRSV